MPHASYRNYFLRSSGHDDGSHEWIWAKIVGSPLSLFPKSLKIRSSNSRKLDSGSPWGSPNINENSVCHSFCHSLIISSPVIGWCGSVWLSQLAQAWAPVLYSYGLYKCTAASLGIDKMKKLVKMMKQMKMIKLVIMSLRIVSGSLGN